MKLTAIGSGYYKVYLDGAEDGQKHVAEREAIEHAMEVKVLYPNSRVTYVHEYEVLVGDKVTIDPEPVSTQLFNKESVYNKKLDDNAPIHPESAMFITELKRQATKNDADGIPWAGINSGLGSTSGLFIVEDYLPLSPITLVDGSRNPRPESELSRQLLAGFRIPGNATPSPKSDGAMCVWDQYGDRLMELWQAKYVDGAWQARWGGIIENVSTSNGVFPTYEHEETGLTATSLSLSALMVKNNELMNGVVPHAIGMAIRRNKKYAFVPPALRTDSGGRFYDDPAPPEALISGMRYRFPKDIVIEDSWCPFVKMAVVAGRDYGIVNHDKSGAVVLYIENTYPITGENELGKYTDGLQAYQAMKQFPWDKLEVLA